MNWWAWAALAALAAAPWLYSEADLALFARRERRHGWTLTTTEKQRLRRAFWDGFTSVWALHPPPRRRR